jgi:hypothetical protein
MKKLAVNKYKIRVMVNYTPIQWKELRKKRLRGEGDSELVRRLSLGTNTNL